MQAQHRTDAAGPADRGISPLASLLAGYSIEITGADRAVAEICEAPVPPGTEVFIAFVPGEHPARIIQAAAHIRAAGLVPVPHIVARALPDSAALDRLLGGFAAQAGVTSALVLAGDRAAPAGPFDSSLGLLEIGLFEAHGFTDLAFACHPEGHPVVDDETMRLALLAKIAATRMRGMRPRLVSQFTLDAGPIAPCLDRLGAIAPDVPIRLGIAGPTSRMTLFRYAAYCGVGTSLRALGRHGEALSHLALRGAPDGLVREIARIVAARPDRHPPVAGIHIFTFGGVANAAAWAESLVAETAAQAANQP